MVEVAEVAVATAFSIGQDNVFDYSGVISAALCYRTHVLEFGNLSLGHLQPNMASKSVSPFLAPQKAES